MASGLLILKPWKRTGHEPISNEDKKVSYKAIKWWSRFKSFVTL